MKRLRLYLDTTIWSFAFADDAPDYKKDTLAFFDKARLGLFEVYSSDTVIDELEAAPMPKREWLLALVGEIEPKHLEKSAEIERMAALYLEKGVLPQKSTADAVHIAFATVYEMDYLLSWNIRHLANANRRAKVTAINVEEGYRFPTAIFNPMEVTYGE